MVYASWRMEVNTSQQENAATDFWSLDQMGTIFHMAKKHGAQVEAYKLQNIRY